MQNIRVHRIKSPWVILALLPLVLLALFALALFMLGSAVLGGRKKRVSGRWSTPDHMPEVPQPARAAAPKKPVALDKAAAIDADFKTI